MPANLMNWRIFAWAWVLLSLLSTSWALATPMVAAPDEPAHMIKAASVVRGQLIGDYENGRHVVQVPRAIAHTNSEICFAFKPAVTGDCAPDVSGDPGEIVDAFTTAGLYNPVYYAAVGWPSLILEGDAGLYGMRIVSGILTMAFLALSIMLVFSWRRPTLPLLGLAVGVTPMLLFLSGTVNPNALEASATVALFAGMLSIVLHPNNSLLATRCALVATSAVIAANTRGLAMIWVFLAIVVPLLLLKWADFIALIRKRSVIITILATGIGAALAITWLLGTSSLSLGTAETDVPSNYPFVGHPPVSGFFILLFGTFYYAKQMIGVFGWLDAPTLEIVYFCWAVFVGALILGALTLLRRRRLVVAVGLVLAFVLIPALVQAAYITNGGLIWQGRYSLPAFLCLSLGIATLIDAPVSTHLSRVPLTRFTAVILIIWAGCQLTSFATTLQRYAVGVEGTWRNTFLDPMWAAPGGNPLMVASFTLFLSASTWILWRALAGRQDLGLPSENGEPPVAAETRGAVGGQRVLV